MGRILEAIHKMVVILTILILLASSVVLYQINQSHDRMRESLSRIEQILEENE